jgi:hypothetical protein
VHHNSLDVSDAALILGASHPESGVSKKFGPDMAILSSLKLSARGGALGLSFFKRLSQSGGASQHPVLGRVRLLSVLQNSRLLAMRRLSTVGLSTVAEMPSLSSFLRKHEAIIRSAVKASCLAGSADLIVQATTNQPQSIGDLNLRRSLSFAIFGFFYGGVFQSFVYRGYDVCFGSGNSVRVVAVKMAADFCVHGPLVYIPSFYMVTGMIQGLGWSGAGVKLKEKYYDTVWAYFAIWPCPMIGCFCMPANMRIVTIAVFAFIEKCIYSFIGQLPSGAIQLESE